MDELVPLSSAAAKDRPTFGKLFFGVRGRDEWIPQLRKWLRPDLVADSGGEAGAVDRALRRLVSRVDNSSSRPRPTSGDRFVVLKPESLAEENEIARAAADEAIQLQTSRPLRDQVAKNLLVERIAAAKRVGEVTQAGWERLVRVLLHHGPDSPAPNLGLTKSEMYARESAGLGFWRTPGAPQVNLLVWVDKKLALGGPLVASAPPASQQAASSSGAHLPGSIVMRHSQAYSRRPGGMPTFLSDSACAGWPPHARPSQAASPLSVSVGELLSAGVDHNQICQLLRGVARSDQGKQTSEPALQYLTGRVAEKLRECCEAQRQPGLRSGEAFGILLPALALAAAGEVMELDRGVQKRGLNVIARRDPMDVEPGVGGAEAGGAAEASGGAAEAADARDAVTLLEMLEGERLPDIEVQKALEE